MFLHSQRTVTKTLRSRRKKGMGHECGELPYHGKKHGLIARVTAPRVMGVDGVLSSWWTVGRGESEAVRRLQYSFGQWWACPR